METQSANSDAIDLRLRDLPTTWQMAVAEERSRLAREIHDTLAQSFAGILLHTEALGERFDLNTSRSKKALLHIKKLAQSGLEEARRSVRALRPKPLEENSLPEALQQAAKCLSRDGKLSCNFHQRGKVFKLPTEVEGELFRIFQEAMTNVRKHAFARSAWITLEFKARQLILTVRDDGVGIAATNFPKRKQSYGLSTMRERAQRIGGTLEVGMPATGGCAVRVVLPVSR